MGSPSAPCFGFGERIKGPAFLLRESPAWAAERRNFVSSMVGTSFPHPAHAARGVNKFRVVATLLQAVRAFACLGKDAAFETHRLKAKKARAPCGVRALGSLHLLQGGRGRLATSYFRTPRLMHYHRGCSVSLPCSEWERVGPLRSDHQTNEGGIWPAGCPCVVSADQESACAARGLTLGFWTLGFRAATWRGVSRFLVKEHLRAPGGAHGACSLTSTYRCLKKYSLSSVSGCLRPELPF